MQKTKSRARKPLRVKTERLHLRPFETADAPRLNEICGDIRVANWAWGIPYPYSEEMALEWIRKQKAERDKGKAYRFAIEAEEVLVGCCDIDEIEEGAGALNFWLAANEWGKGYGYEAAEAVVGFAFNHLGLNMIRSGYLNDNVAAGRILAKLGFGSAGYDYVFAHARRRSFLHARVKLEQERWAAA